MTFQAAAGPDRPGQQLLALLGSFWGADFDGRATTAAYLDAFAAADAQGRQDFQAAAAAVARLGVALLARDHWTPLPVRQLDRVAYPALPSTFAWALPAGVNEVPAVLDLPGAASVCWASGVDYVVDKSAGVIAFLDDPFAEPAFARAPVFDGALMTDTELTLWLYWAGSDRRTLANQFGYVFGLDAASSAAFAALVNACWDGALDGGPLDSCLRLLASLLDVPLSQGSETAEIATLDRGGRVVVTDQNVYRLRADATLLVSVGQALSVGQPLADPLRYYSFNQGVVPDALTSLSLGPGFVQGPHVQGKLTFENATLPTTVVEHDTWTELRFPVGGSDHDVTAFWDWVNDQSRALGTTLADLLDPRTVKEGPPPAEALPTTINPLQFVVENCLRFHGGLVLLKSSLAGPDTPGLAQVTLLRQFVAPWAHLFVVDLDAGPADVLDTADAGSSLSSSLSSQGGVP